MYHYSVFQNLWYGTFRYFNKPTLSVVHFREKNQDCILYFTQAVRCTNSSRPMDPTTSGLLLHSDQGSVSYT